ncbi:MAG: hypothetical protein M1826_007341 [Phylliscum demangeonii]|nr:MAG: hypothetical protein M1826_007341 [Phylliscum demangeonii]
MDVDMDIDLGSFDEMAGMEQQMAALPPPYSNSIFQTPAPAHAQPTHSPGSSPPSQDVVPHKVHLRGLDHLRTSDIIAFAAAHFPEVPNPQVEWIDDSSANVVYQTAAVAEKALASMSAMTTTEEEEGTPTAERMLQLRPTKPVPTKADCALEARLAVGSDKKVRGARDRSRFYLLNPQDDRVHNKAFHVRTRTVGWQKGRVGDRSQPRRKSDDGYDRGRAPRADDDERETFDASMYDDDAGALSARQVTDRQRRGAGRRRRLGPEGNAGNSGKELLPARADHTSRGEARDRSASPGRRGGAGEDVDMEVDAVSGQLKRWPENYRRRSRSRRRGGQEQQRDRVVGRANAGKELFPAAKSGKELVSAAAKPAFGGSTRNDSASLDLFPRRSLATTITTITSATTLDASMTDSTHTGTNNSHHHRRSDAFDATPSSHHHAAHDDLDDATDLFAGRMSVPFTDGAIDHSRNARRGSGSHNQRAKDTNDAGFSIRGLARQGFSIRGAASANAAATASGTAATAPATRLRASENVGKELFAEKLVGRDGGGGGSRGIFAARAGRKRAEDMF